MIDTHCHLLPNLDDGPSDWDQSLALAQTLVADGITEVIATPHQLGMFGNVDACEQIRLEVGRLNKRLTKAGIDLKVYSGAEIRLDVNLSKLLDEGMLLTLADSPYLLLELPSQQLIDITVLINDLINHDLIPVIAHAERLTFLKKKSAVLSHWRSAGALIQVTAPGLMGDWGSKISTFAWQLILSGYASVLATDAHDTDKRRPRLTEAHAAVAARLGIHIADRLTMENPAKILSGADLVPLFVGQNKSFHS